MVPCKGFKPDYIDLVFVFTFLTMPSCKTICPLLITLAFKMSKFVQNDVKAIWGQEQL